MSEVNRYNVVLRVPNDSPFRQTGDSCLRPKNAEVVLASDYDALAADNQRLKNEADYYRNTLRNVLKDIRDDLVRGGLPPSWDGVACTISVVLGYDRAALAGSKEGDL